MLAVSVTRTIERTARRRASLPAHLRYFRGVCEREGCEQLWRGFHPNQRFCSRRCDRIAAQRARRAARQN